MKGNILLGQARGKLGDMVFARTNGQQVARARAQQVKNPRTEKQMIQRIILNTIAQAYSAMQPICDHSFEGVAAGQNSMSFFMRKNMDALRAKIAQELNNGYEFDSIYSFSPINSNQLVPNVYIISKGTLPSIEATTSGSTTGQIALSANTYEAMISDYGLQRGDQITFVAMQGTNASALKFYYARVILDPKNADGTDAPLSSALVADGAVNLPSPRNEGNFNTLSFADGALSFNFSAQSLNAVAVIVSRQKTDGNWMRSNASFTLNDAAISGWYPSLQDCLNLIASGGIDTLSDYYLNNSGTGVLAGASPEPAMSITSATVGSTSITSPTDSKAGSAFNGQTVRVNVANVSSTKKIFIENSSSPKQVGNSVTGITPEDGVASTSFPGGGADPTGYITIGICADDVVESVWTVVTLTSASNEAPVSGDGD